MKFENTNIMNFRGALRGMRNPMNSWDKSDSLFGYYDCENCDHNHLCHECITPDRNNYAIEAPIIGKNDMQLAQQLIRSGTEHRKFMRQIFVCVDITAPAYFMAEFDTYKVGTVRNSTSFMHKGTSKPFEIEDFEIDSENIIKILSTRQIKEKNEIMDDYEDDYEIFEECWIWEKLLNTLNNLREKYLETKDYKYFRLIRQLLPQSYLYTSTVTLSYENLLAICSKGQRRYHKLNEWSGQDNPKLTNFISWARTLPYAQELIFIDELEKTDNISDKEGD